MLKPKHNKLVYAFFSWYINKIISKDFEEFSYNHVEIDQNKAILVLSNHFSWWDGFLIFQLNRLLWKKHFHVMVSEENYKNVGFLKYMGAFSIAGKSKGVIKSLRFAGELLSDSNNMLLIFPQGKLHSNHVAEITFKKGLAKVIEYSNNNFQYVFASMFSDYFRHRKPIVTAYLQSKNCDESDTATDLERAYNSHYQDARNRQTVKSV